MNGPATLSRERGRGTAAQRQGEGGGLRGERAPSLTLARLRLACPSPAFAGEGGCVRL